MKRFTILTALMWVLAGAGRLAAQNAPIRLEGKVVDETGAVMRSVDVKAIQGKDDDAAQVSKTDAEGAFALDLASGEYLIEVAAPDFETVRQSVRVAAGVKPLLIELKLASVVLEVEVASDTDTVSVDPDNHVNGINMTGEELADLPDSPEDLIEYLNDLAASLPGTGDLDLNAGEFVIDGLSGGQLPSKEQIAAIRIVEDLSAEGGRRIEIVTKAGTGPWHADMSLGFRDDALDARTPLTDGPEPERRDRTYTTHFSGPIIQNKLGADFTIRSSESERGSQSIRAITPLGQFSDTLVSPTVTRGFSISNIKWDFVPGQHSMTAAISYESQRQDGSGVSGFNLPERASDRRERNWTFELRQNSTVGQFVNVWRVQFNHSSNERTPVSIADPIIPGAIAVNVQDAFYGGAAQNRSTSRSSDFIFTEQFQTTAGKWTFKVNGQLERRHPISESENNYQGTYTFSSLHDYCVASGFYGDNCQETLDIWNDAMASGTTPVYSVAGAGGSMTARTITGVPTQFTQTVGDPRLEQRITTFRTEFRADWRKTDRFSLSATVRHQVENYLHHLGNFSPTLTARYQILPKTTVTVAGNLNVSGFNGGAYEQILRSGNGARQSNIIISNPTYTPGQAPYDGAFQITPQATTIRVLAGDYQDPYNLQTQVQLARQISRNLTANVTFSASRGLHQTRYRNINAPFPGAPLPEDLLARLNAIASPTCDSTCALAIRAAARDEVNAMRPDPAQGNILQYESSGKSSQQTLSFGMRLNNFMVGSVTRLSVQENLNLRWAKDTPSQPVNSWDPMAEWGRSSNDQRLQLRSRININWFPMRSWKWQFNTNFRINVNSGRPYNITTGRDDNGDTVTNDRPEGVARNSGTAPSNYNIDLTFSKRFYLIPPDPPRESSSSSSSGGQRNGGGGRGNRGDRGDRGDRDFAGGGGSGDRGRRSGGTSGSRRYVTLQVQIRNLFNNVQLRPPSGVVTSPFFGISNSAAAGRQIQLGMQMSLF
ncbi:MAG TPA: carboxypeptidase regulatory-like domain-containing protein [Terriglobia bacterium]|nr:carboxypeptidase regulatory-like domain-containing protein [Terriglobia bacterium]